MSLDMSEALARLGLLYIPLLFALCFHEFAHAWVAKLKGDNTADLMGRMSLNPFVHMDIVGTFILPVAAILTGLPVFGWAKPVPVNSRNLAHVKEDMFWIAAAGPLSNIFLALVGSLIWAGVAIFMRDLAIGSALIEIFNFFILINLVLAAFNMLPFHPLDGGKVLARFLPLKANRWLEENQMYTSYALILLFILGGFRYLLAPLMYVHQWMKIGAASLFSIFV